MYLDFGLAQDAPGSADTVIEHDGHRLSMTASYLIDALGDLLGALRDLVSGAPKTDFDWTKQPGGWRWDLT